MNVVIDTNVVLSAIFFNGIPLKVLDAWRKGRFQWIISPAILFEYREGADNLAERYEPIDTDRFLDLIAIHTLLVRTYPLLNSPCRDPNDTLFIEAALAGDAGIIVSGDRDLLVLSGYRNIEVLTPKQFLERLD